MNKRTYQAPETEMVSLNCNGIVMQGIIVNSPYAGNVDPDNPVGPDVPELANSVTLWDEEKEGGDEPDWSLDFDN